MKRLVEECLILDIFRLNEIGFFSRGSHTTQIGWSDKAEQSAASMDANLEVLSTGTTLTLQYYQKRQGEAPEIVSTKLEIVHNACHYGGLRRWFVCPIEGCRRIVAKLYLPPVLNKLACRRCHRLAYLSQRSSGRFQELRGRSCLSTAFWRRNISTNPSLLTIQVCTPLLPAAWKYRGIDKVKLKWIRKHSRVRCASLAPQAQATGPRQRLIKQRFSPVHPR